MAQIFFCSSRHFFSTDPPCEHSHICISGLFWPWFSQSEPLVYCIHLFWEHTSSIEITKQLFRNINNSKLLVQVWLTIKKWKLYSRRSLESKYYKLACPSITIIWMRKGQYAIFRKSYGEAQKRHLNYWGQYRNFLKSKQ